MQDATMPVSSTVILGLLGIAASAFTHWIVSTRAASRFEGVVNTRLDAHDSDIEELKDVDENQWKEIRRMDREVAMCAHGTKRPH